MDHFQALTGLGIAETTPSHPSFHDDDGKVLDLDLHENSVQDPSPASPSQQSTITDRPQPLTGANMTQAASTDPGFDNQDSMEVDLEDGPVSASSRGSSTDWTTEMDRVLAEHVCDNATVDTILQDIERIFGPEPSWHAVRSQVYNMKRILRHYVKHIDPDNYFTEEDDNKIWGLYMTGFSDKEIAEQMNGRSEKSIEGARHIHARRLRNQAATDGIENPVPAAQKEHATNYLARQEPATDKSRVSRPAPEPKSTPLPHPAPRTKARYAAIAIPTSKKRQGKKTVLSGPQPVGELISLNQPNTREEKLRAFVDAQWTAITTRRLTQQASATTPETSDSDGTSTDSP